MEKALLRQQLSVLKRPVQRPALINSDRFRLVFLSHIAKFWKQALHIGQPETLLRWHRELFRIYWRQKSQGKPKVPPETISLIQKMAKENHLWGTERIRGELLKLGLAVSKGSIQKYMPKERRSRASGPTWATFLKNQAGAMGACDFTVVSDWLFRPGYIFVVLELETRRIVHTGATKFPTDEWTAQPLRAATSWGRGPKCLIRDRASKYAARFSAGAVRSGIPALKTPYRTPRANGICERFMGSLRRECLDPVLFQEGKHVQRVVREYIAYFNQERPHQGMGQRIPNHSDLLNSKPTGGRIRSKAILGGLHHRYTRAAYLN